jgi:N-acetylglucosamine kinase-like BadF-type ATPase
VAAATPAQVAGLAPEVLRAAREGDRSSAAMVGEAARELAALVAALIRHFPSATRVDVAATGGLLGTDSPLREALADRLAEAVPRARFRGDALDPALAAARLALGAG